MFVSTSAVNPARFSLVLAGAVALSMLFASHAFAAKQKVTINAASNSTVTSSIVGGSANVVTTVQGCLSFFCNQKANSTNSATTGISSSIVSGSANVITVIQSSN